ncbi:hypothetical protein C7B61_17715 [filamentous cyanobacterium CCP1]|nr:hypothetical protein C7B76_26425 [filamentous cyanobacterium CCP2]PSB60306.1 hypothetical protein C7B61_17715 [filamentous cyanobacterium CCP1]
MLPNEDFDSTDNSTNQSSNEAEQDANEQTPGERLAAINSNPKISLEEARNANEGEAPNAAGSSASSSAEGHVPSSSDPESSDLPTSR